MNKRQKKKQVKRAIENFAKLKDSKRDKVVMNTIGTNVKVRNELILSYALYYFSKAYMKKVMQVAESVFESVKIAIASIAKELDMDSEELIAAANSLSKTYGISGSQAIDMIVKGHHSRVEQDETEESIDRIKDPEEMNTITDREHKDIHYTENEQVLDTEDVADSFYKPSLWKRLKSKVMRR